MPATSSRSFSVKFFLPKQVLKKINVYADSMELFMFRFPSGVVNDPTWVVTIRSLYQKVVREWIIKSLSYAPCTSQGLLQVENSALKYVNF